MFSGKSKEIIVITLLVLAAFLGGSGGNIFAYTVPFSVNINNIHYADSSPRAFDYDFSTGVGDANTNTITIPTTDPNLSYTFGPYPGQNDITVQHYPSGSTAVLRTTTKGAALLNTVPAATSQAVNQWEYAVQFGGFSYYDPTATQEYRTQIGLAPQAPGPHPVLSATWTPMGDLVLKAAIVNEATDQTFWSAVKKVQSFDMPTRGSSSVIELRIRRNGDLIFEYRFPVLDSTTWTYQWTDNWSVLATFPIGNSADVLPYGSFPSLSPFVALEIATPRGGNGLISYSSSVSAATGYPNAPVEGATVTLTGPTGGDNYTYGSRQTTTDAQGAFTLQNLRPEQNLSPNNGGGFGIKITATGYLDVYSAAILIMKNFTGLKPYALYTADEAAAGPLQSWDRATKGVILGTVVNTEPDPDVGLAGAVVTAADARQGYGTYPVTYTGGGNATAADGMFYVLNVPDGTPVLLTVQQRDGYSWIFTQAQITAHAGAISEESFFGKPATMITYRGRAKTFYNSAFDTTWDNAIVEAYNAGNNNLIWTTALTNPQGIINDFSLSIPSGTPFYLFVKSHYYGSVKSANMMFTADYTGNDDFITFTPYEVPAWNTDKGIIRSTVKDENGNPIAGAQVIVVNQSQPNASVALTVCYDDACTPGLTSTGANGLYLINNVQSIINNIVTVTAQKEGFSFNRPVFDVVSIWAPYQGVIYGTPLGNCSYALDPSTLSPPATGSATLYSVSVSVTGGPACSWDALTTYNWLPFTDVGGINSASGSGSVQFTVDANGGAARTGTITIAGQTLTVNQAGSSVTYDLAVAINGTGSGMVTATGLSCTGASCTGSYTSGTQVTLTADAGANAIFVTWGGDAASCGIASTCQVTMDAAKNVTATFGLNTVNGVCGSAQGQTLTAAPTTNLCSAGTASSLSGTGPWSWNCSGANGGATASCSANIQLPGDLDDNGTVDLTDAVLGLQLLSGLTPAKPLYKQADVDGNGHLGLPEVVYILQRAAEIR